MAYATPLEARIAKKVTRAITEYNLIEDGDRVMVGLSGGKDSWALIQMLDVLRRRAPIDFSVIAVTVDSGYNGYRHDLISRTCEARGWEYRIEHTEIGETIEDMGRGVERFRISEMPNYIGLLRRADAGPPSAILAGFVDIVRQVPMLWDVASVPATIASHRRSSQRRTASGFRSTP